MAEKLPIDYIGQRLEIQRELFQDTRLAETGLPFDDESLAQGLGETGLSGYYLQYDARHATPPKGLRPLLDQADDIVAKTLERHNRDARFIDPPYSAAYYILDPSTLNTVAAITASIVKKWARPLWTKDQTLLLPDRRRYKYRGGQLTEEEEATEAHAKGVIIEVGAAVMEAGSLAVGDLSTVTNARMVSEIVTGRGPEFLRQWLSKDILSRWLETTGRLDEKEAWDAFAVKGILLSALTSDIANPLRALDRMKKAHDGLTTEAIALRTGWPADRINTELPANTRKQIARKYTNVNEGLDRIVQRLEAATVSNICTYTGWEQKKVEIIFTLMQRRKIATERSDPVREAVMAIAKAYDFLEDTQALADLLGRPAREVTAMFNPVIRRDIAKQARPGKRGSTLGRAEIIDEAADADELRYVKAAVREVAKRLDLLRSPEALGTLIGWTPEQTSKRIRQSTINHFATKGGDFMASVHKFCSDLASLDDARLASAIGISEQTARDQISWGIRQQAVVDLSKNPLKALTEWWRGDRKIGSAERLPKIVE